MFYPPDALVQLRPVHTWQEKQTHEFSNTRLRMLMLISPDFFVYSTLMFLIQVLKLTLYKVANWAYNDKPHLRLKKVFY